MASAARPIAIATSFLPQKQACTSQDAGWPINQDLDKAGAIIARATRIVVDPTLSVSRIVCNAGILLAVTLTVQAAMWVLWRR